MDESQEIKISLKEYVELKNAFDHRKHIEINTTTHRDSLANERSSSHSVHFALANSREATMRIASELASIISVYNDLYLNICSFFRDLKSFNYFKFNKFKKNLLASESIRDFVTTTLATQAPISMILEPKNIQLPEGYSLLKTKDHEDGYELYELIIPKTEEVKKDKES